MITFVIEPFILFGYCFITEVGVHKIIFLHLLSGNITLLEYLLKDHFTTPEKSGIRDPNSGNTILHLACIFPVLNPVFRKEVIMLALKYGVDPLTKNKNSKMAVECFISRDPACHQILTAAMEKKRLAGMEKLHKRQFLI